MTRTRARSGDPAMPPLRPLAMPVQSLDADWTWLWGFADWLYRLVAPEPLRDAKSRPG